MTSRRGQTDSLWIVARNNVHPALDDGTSVTSPELSVAMVAADGPKMGRIGTHFARDDAV